MLFNIISFFLGATFSFFLYACILTGAKSDKEDYKLCQKNDIIG